jgi:uncharacterized protein (TIGR03545 family)
MQEEKKAAKKFVNLIPLAFAGILAAGLVVFFSIFVNPLLERAMEMGLETVFEAKSDVRRLRLSLLRFRLAIDEITVADRDKPMKNLFQMGRIEIRLKPDAVLRGKIYIEEIRADNIRFGTERKVSGALPARPPKVKQQKPKSEIPPLVDLQNFNARALLESEYDKLASPKLYDEAIAAYNETLAKWQGQAALAKTLGEELQTASQPILSLNVNSISDLQSIPKIVQDVNVLINTAKSAADDAAIMINSIDADIKTARNLEQNARNAVTADINLLKSYINLGSGTALAVLEPIIRDILTDTAEQYLDYGQRALEVLAILKTQAEAIPKTEKPKKAARIAYKGRDVIFPVRAYPKFFMGILASDFTLNAWNWAFDLRDVSSDPDLYKKPVTLALGLNESGDRPGRQIAFRGSANFASSATELYSTKIEASGFPVRLGNQMKAAGINGFSGSTAFSFNLSNTNGNTSGGGDVRISHAQLVDPAGTLAVAVDEAIREAGQVNLGIQYTAFKDQKDEFKITTNLIDLITRALRAAAEAYAKQALDEIERVVRERISQYIDGKFISSEELDTLLRLARGDKTALDQLNNALTDKRFELEKKAKNAADKTVQQASQDILQGSQPSTPSIPSPSIPGGGGIKFP